MAQLGARDEILQVSLTDLRFMTWNNAKADEAVYVCRRTWISEMPSSLSVLRTIEVAVDC